MPSLGLGNVGIRSVFRRATLRYVCGEESVRSVNETGTPKNGRTKQLTGGRTRDTFKLLLLLLSHKRKRDTDTHTTVSFQKNNNKNGKNIYRDPQLRVNKTANCGYGCFDRTRVTKKRMQGPKFQRRSSSSSSPSISHLRNSRAFP